MKNNKQIIIAFSALIILGVPWLMNTYPQSMRFVDKIFSYTNDSYATVFFHDVATAKQLQNKYVMVPKGESKVRILIVPGHEPSFGGTEYNDLKERDLNVELAQDLRDFFKGDSHYEIITSRDNVSWNPDFQKYFTDHWNDIISFLKENKDATLRSISSGNITKIADGVKHNKAPVDVALRLYGINKWVNENKVDIVIHIHFNDYPRNNFSTPGEYSGFSIYVPEKQYANGTTTKVIADAVFKRLSKYEAISNLKKESAGITEDQDLIAIGSYNTLDIPSMLIEYGYIYEPQFFDKITRDVILKDMAYQTYLGIQDFFGEKQSNISDSYDTQMLPHSWKEEINKKTTDKGDVLSLQAALTLEGFYPGIGKTKNDCPISGMFGPCTIEALGNFQKKYGITSEKGIVGEQTKNILNSEYSVKLK